MRFSIIVLLLSALIASCGGSNSITEPSQTNSDVLIPLSSGNKWVYRTTYSDPDGHILGSSTDSSFIGLSTTIIGKKWFFYNTLGTTDPDNIVLLRNTNQGVFQLEETSQIEFLAFKYPAKVGDSYTLFSSEFSSFSSSMEVLSIDTEITTEKGTFKCYEYRPSFTDGINSTKIIFIAPHIGIIKEVEINAAFTDEKSPDPIFGVTRERGLIDFKIQ